MKSKILLILIFMTAAVFAQVPEIARQQCYNYSTTSGSDEAVGIIKTNTGYLMAIDVYGNTELPNYHGSFDILIVSIDTIGNVIWEKCYGGSARDFPNKIVDAGNDTYYVLGRTNSTDGDVQSGNNGSNDFWVFKINVAGDLIWEKTYGSPAGDKSKNMITMPDGGFLFTGDIKADGGDVSVCYGDWDIWLCRCDSTGNILWEKTLGNEGADSGEGLLINSEGNIMTVGTIEEEGGTVSCTPEGLKDIWLAEIDMQGNILADHCYGAAYSESIGYGITEVDDGYFVLGHSSGIGINDIRLTKIDDQLNIIWEKLYGGNIGDYPACLLPYEEGNFILF